MENQIGTVLHWSNQKKREQAKSKDEVIRRNLDRIHISAAILLYPQTHPGTAKWALVKKFFKNPHQKIKSFWLPDHMSDQVEI